MHALIKTFSANEFSNNVRTIVETHSLLVLPTERVSLLLCPYIIITSSNISKIHFLKEKMYLGAFNG